MMLPTHPISSRSAMSHSPIIRLSIGATLACLLLVSLCAAQEAVTAHRRTLDELVDESAFIVHGHVAAVRLEPHPDFSNLPTVVVTMDVDDVLKGEVPRKFVFRQFVWDVRAAHDNGYKRQQEILLFLRPPSRYGLTSPSGLSQGRFTVRRDASGKAVAANAGNNAGLFASLPKAAQARGATMSASTLALSRQTQGAVGLGDLKDAVRMLVGRAR